MRGGCRLRKPRLDADLGSEHEMRAECNCGRECEAGDGSERRQPHSHDEEEEDEARESRDEAREQFTRALDLGSKSASTAFELAGLLRDAKADPARVIEMLDKASEKLALNIVALSK